MTLSLLGYPTVKNEIKAPKIKTKKSSTEVEDFSNNMRI
jgi:hypothetical protein